MYDHPPSAGGETKVPQHSKWGHRSGLGPGADHQAIPAGRLVLKLVLVVKLRICDPFLRISRPVSPWLYLEGAVEERDDIEEFFPARGDFSANPPL